MADRPNRPRAREKHVTSGKPSGGFGGSRPSGGGSSHSGGSHHSSGNSYHSSDHSSGYSGGGYHGGTRAGGGGGLIKIIIIIAVILLGGGGSLSGILGGGSSILGGSSDFQESVMSGSGVSSGWTLESNSGRLNTEVSPAARDKFTQIKGNGKDKITLMVYMCGTDLESRSSMATSDLQEMLRAAMSDNINLIVYTGGCKGWRNSTISSKYNQVWQLKNGKIKCLIENAGNAPMTDASTLKEFVTWTAAKYPANRYQLIFWDHGGGSVSGYGYDEKYPQAGAMKLGSINKALKSTGIKFDFVGFDACLMATTETALMLSEYADYLIGSEETEPGIGWYYTNWLTKLSEDPGMDTLDLGKIIADDFTEACARSCRGQQTTLSVVDLAELSQTLPAKMNAFAQKAGDMIQDGNYKDVATARSSSKEFARSTNIDQVDFAHFANLTGTQEGKDLVKTLLGAVKYNRTSSNIANAYGLSIYFPYKKLNKVDSMSSTYDEIGMDDEYTECIQRFAQMQVSGQAVSGGSSTSSPLQSIFGSGYGGSGSNPFGTFGGSGSSGNSTSNQAMNQLIQSLLGGGRSIADADIEGLDESNTQFMEEELLDPDEVTEYVTEDRITSDDMKWQQNSDGDNCIMLTEEQWEKVTEVDMGMFYDDGREFLALGLDNVFTFDDDGNLLPENDGTWLALDEQTVTYYHDETLEFGDDKYQINGHVPVYINGERADLILVFDQDDPTGRIAGVAYDVDEETTDTSAKVDASLQEGDELQFVYDVYTYEGSHKGEKVMGDPLKVKDPDSILISNVKVGSGSSKVTYRFTDIFGQNYWTESL